MNRQLLGGFVALLLLVGTDSWARKEKVEPQAVAKEMHSLARRCIAAGLPHKFPFLLRFKPGIDKRAISDYDKYGWPLWEGFFEYPIYRHFNHALYKDLKRFWKNDPKDLTEAVLLMEPYYKSELDENMKSALVEMIAFVLSEIRSVDDPGALNADAWFPYGQYRNLILNLLEYETSHESAIDSLLRSLQAIARDSDQDQNRRFLAVLARDGSADCERASYEIFIASMMGHRQTFVAEALYDIVTSSVCDLRSAFISHCSVFVGQYHRCDDLAMQWLHDAIASPTEDHTGENELIYLYVNRKWRKELVPQLIEALEAKADKTRCLAIGYLPYCTGIQANDLPYDEFDATTTIADTIDSYMGRNNSEWLDQKMKLRIQEHAKAIRFWKEWWLEHKEDGAYAGSR